MISELRCKNATILIVDDKLPNIQLLENILKTAGYTNLHSTTDPRQTFQLFLELVQTCSCWTFACPILTDFRSWTNYERRLEMGIYPFWC